MILQLKTSEDKILFEASITVQPIETNPTRQFVELSAKINIKNYSRFLIDNIDKSGKIIIAFDNLNELQGWLWEGFFTRECNDGTHKNKVVEKLRIILTKVAKDYNLSLMESE